NILHVGRTAHYLYYSMELADDHLAGRKIDIASYQPRTLKTDLARQKRLSADESIRLGLSLTEALGALHGRGLIHRDIKPSNIIFIDNVPKLADIGLVATSGQQSFVGTEGYVPPEGPGTAQADIYSLGKVLYEISMGKDRLDFPEIGTNLDERDDKEQLLQLNEILLKACAPTPAKRYADAEELRHDLVRIESGKPARRSRAARIGILLAIVALLIAAAAFRYFRNQTAQLPAIATITT